MPCVLGDAESALSRIVPELVATRDLYLVYRREARVSTQVDAVLRLVVEVITEKAPLVTGRGALVSSIAHA